MLSKTKISKIELASYICNASGPSDSILEELEIIAKSDSSAIMMKSCTIKPRIGNPEPRYVHLPLGSIQSMGLPNLGYQKYIRFASQLKKYNKPIIASVAGLSIEDYRVMVEAFQKSEVNLIEVNLSCPNVEGKSQVAYDFEQTEKVLRVISNLGDIPLGLKLPAYFDFIHQKQMAQLILKYNISFITCINSVGNTLFIDPEKEMPVIKPKKGFGGLCGDYIKPIALANVRAFYELLDDKVSIFGVGGIKSGLDAFEFLIAGADAVQVATVFEKEGESCFTRINQELEEILKRKNYNSIQEAKGRLKHL
ncbi:MAG: Dihydroorotate dehydrogenase [Candidatus Moranbacteria bacterium GW2011_GWF2_36_839]|nr:MAG: Dihydroorotate dehydrogenase [Candidatus Moranbacteria bacterium GW2011_GWF1_36_78]KKQ17741.1 MAG: Dihydroorotate dehydrogenase [Candidatus Moranbacteria bacterium GW2011_GWF2_36_839]HAT73443.1 dihydroorotate oxidase [Candidatus Moranbacteria bacterium]HBY10805.1 dihydroorotate oxidase [Candidatus Moranbacteria bacterium]